MTESVEYLRDSAFDSVYTQLSCEFLTIKICCAS